MGGDGGKDIDQLCEVREGDESAGPHVRVLHVVNVTKTLPISIRMLKKTSAPVNKQKIPKTTIFRAQFRHIKFNHAPLALSIYLKNLSKVFACFTLTSFLVAGRFFPVFWTGFISDFIFRARSIA